MPTLLTPRLQLVSLSCDHLAELLGPPSTASELLGSDIEPGLVDPAVERAIGIKLDKMAHVPRQDHPWWTYWLAIERSSGRAVGMLGFKGLSEDKDVEIGYGIAPAFRSRGFATEAAARLIEWAFSDRRCSGITAIAVASDNRASERVLEKLGMKLVARGAGGSDWHLVAKRPAGQSG